MSKKYVKSSYAQYLKSSQKMRGYGIIHERLKNNQFKLVLPMEPKDRISGKGSSTQPDYPCLESMNLMINCLKKSDYNEATCSAEVQNFTDCYKNFTNDCKTVAELNRKGIYKVDPNQIRYPIKFMQRLLSQFKTPRKVDNGPDIPAK